jgi:hypothetical protein
LENPGTDYLRGYTLPGPRALTRLNSTAWLPYDVFFRHLTTARLAELKTASQAVHNIQ